MARLDAFLRVVVQQGASDLHLCSAAVPYIRRDGDLVHLPFRALSDREMRRFLFEVLPPDKGVALSEGEDLEFVYQLEGAGRFRGNVFHHAGGLGAVLRIVPELVPGLQTLRLPPVIEELAAEPSGLILVCGATGAGKSTTVAAILDHINQRWSRHIITVEDPVELIHRSVRSVISQREVGVHAPSFAAAVRSALRESPDVVAIGEMRDADTIRLALNAAEAGVLVLGTLHASSAPSALHRIVDVMPVAQRSSTLQVLGETFRGIVSQRLVKARAGEGRVPVLEVVRHTPSTSQMVRDGKVHQLEAMLNDAEDEGGALVGLDASLQHTVERGLCTLDDALGVALQPERLRAQLLSARKKAWERST